MNRVKTTTLALALLTAATATAQGDELKFEPKDSVQQRQLDEFLLATQKEQAWRISAAIPGMADGAAVKLKSTDGQQTVLAQTVAQGGSFVLDGVAEGPLYGKLHISDKAEYGQGEHPKERGVELCVEPGVDVRVRAELIDSVPLIWEMNGSPVWREQNVEVSGGTAQRHFAEYKAAVRPAALKEAAASRDYRAAKYGLGAKADATRASELEPLLKQAERELAEAEEAFMAGHPGYSIALRLQQERMGDMFRYSDAELDGLLSRFAANEDTLRYEAFCQQVAALRPYTSGRPYTDLAVVGPDGSGQRLKDYVKPGCVNLIDFWASWCGPCRAAIPQLKQLAAECGERLNVVSVSVDEDENAWRRAMQQEQMPWQQLLLPKSEMGALREAYQVTAIPYLLIIDGDGRIVRSTHSPDEAHDVIR